MTKRWSNQDRVTGIEGELELYVDPWSGGSINGAVPSYETGDPVDELCHFLDKAEYPVRAQYLAALQAELQLLMNHNIGLTKYVLTKAHLQTSLATPSSQAFSKQIRNVFDILENLSMLVQVASLIGLATSLLRDVRSPLNAVLALVMGSIHVLRGITRTARVRDLLRDLTQCVEPGATGPAPTRLGEAQKIVRTLAPLSLEEADQAARGGHGELEIDEEVPYARLGRSNGLARARGGRPTSPDRSRTRVIRLRPGEQITIVTSL